MPNDKPRTTKQDWETVVRSMDQAIIDRNMKCPIHKKTSMRSLFFQNKQILSAMSGALFCIDCYESGQRNHGVHLIQVIEFPERT